MHLKEGWNSFFKWWNLKLPTGGTFRYCKNVLDNYKKFKNLKEKFSTPLKQFPFHSLVCRQWLYVHRERGGKSNYAKIHLKSSVYMHKGSKAAVAFLIFFPLTKKIFLMKNENILQSLNLTLKHFRMQHEFKNSDCSCCASMYNHFMLLFVGKIEKGMFALSLSAMTKRVSQILIFLLSQHKSNV